MTWQDLVYARAQVIRFLRQVRPEDRLGIYLMGSNRFWILHEYTENCADLLARLAAWKPADGAVPGNSKSLDVWSEFALQVAGVDAETASAIHRGQFWGTSAGPSPVLPEGAGDAARKAGADFGAYLPPDQNRPITLLECATEPGPGLLVLIDTLSAPFSHVISGTLAHSGGTCL